MTEQYLGLVPTPLAGLAPYLEDGVLADIFLKALTPHQRMLLFFTSDPMGVRQYPPGTGQKVMKTREAEHYPGVDPSLPGTNPTPSTHKAEQFWVQPQQYDGMIQIDRLTNYLAAGDRRMREIQNFIKTHAAKKIDNVAGRASYATYNGGHSIVLNTSGGTTSLRVSCINGFTHLIDANGELQPVSTANPKFINHNGTIRQITAAVADDAVNSAFGPGTLTLSIAAAVNAGEYVIAQDAPTLIYAGKGFDVDAIGAADTLTYDDIDRATQELRSQNVEPFSDGYYRAFVNSKQEGQLLADPTVRALTSHRGLSQSPDPEIENATIVIAAGVRFIRCNPIPDGDHAANLGLTQTGHRSNAIISKQIWAETTNGDGISIGRVMIFGDKCGELHYIPADLDPEAAMVSSLVSPAQFSVSPEGIMVWPQPWIRFLLSPSTSDVHRNKIEFSFLAYLDTVCPSDFYGGYTANRDLSVVAGRNPRFKRAVTIVHAA